MASIGNFTFTTFQGRMMPAKRLVGLVEPAVGVDGYAVALGAWRNDPVMIRGILNVSSIAQAESLREQYRGSIASVVSVFDQFGVTWQNVIVMEVSAEYSFTLFNSVRIESTWKLLNQTTQAQGAL